MDYSLSLVLSLAILFLVIVNICYSYSRYNNTRITLISLWLFIYVCYLFVIPAIYGFSSNFDVARSYGIKSDHLILVHLFEIIFLLVFLVAFHSNYSKRIGRSFQSYVTVPKKGKVHIILLMFFVFAAIVLLVDKLLADLPAYGGITKYDGDVQSGTNSYLGIPAMILAILNGIFYDPGKIAAAIILFIPYDSKWKISYREFYFYKTVSLLFFGSVYIYGLLIGVRHITIGVIILLFAVCILYRRYKQILILSIGFAIIMFLAPVVGSKYRVLLTPGTSITHRLKMLASLTAEKDEPWLDSFWEQVGSRLIDVQVMTGLIKNVENEGHVGFEPLKNSLYAPIPRILWKTKPAPCSCDGTYEGLARFIVWGETIGRWWGLCGGYTAAIHSWWEFGVMGIIACALIYGGFLRVVLEATSNKGFVGMLIFLLVMNAERFDCFFMKSLPDLYLFIIQKLIPILVILRLWTKCTQSGVNSATVYQLHENRSIIM